MISIEFRCTVYANIDKYTAFWLLPVKELVSIVFISFVDQRFHLINSKQCGIQFVVTFLYYRFIW